ncbi:antitoxin Xre/MbcA/ParS toxin-binding domain-containing protein [Hydrogenophaga sp.]|uniref:antitoxin Xre/MbcA/ParS toxin-binding domain-containing protein n=1 Tax=Hydrogenophaga sp. TaxID=1904254 RepID=UPI002FCC3FE5
MGGAANWDLLAVLGVFTAVMCGFAWYVYTHSEPEQRREVNEASTTYSVECGREQDGRYWAAVHALPGVLAHGKSRSEAKDKVSAMALRTLAERLEANQTKAHSFNFCVPAESTQSAASSQDEESSLPSLQEVERMAADTFETRADAAQWLRSPHPMFAGQSPLQVAQTEKGAERVKAMLTAIKYGGVA